MKKQSTLFYPDGHSEKMAPALAYLLWLSTPGTVLRTYSDKRPVQSWECQVARGVV
jgi:hypothetical protein